MQQLGEMTTEGSQQHTQRRCAQGSLLEGTGGPYAVPRIEQELTVCQTSALPYVLSLQSQPILHFNFSVVSLYC